MTARLVPRVLREQSTWHTQRDYGSACRHVGQNHEFTLHDSSSHALPGDTGNYDRLPNSTIPRSTSLVLNQTVLSYQSFVTWRRCFSTLPQAKDAVALPTLWYGSIFIGFAQLRMFSATFPPNRM